jgi:hypothetical protein
VEPEGSIAGAEVESASSSNGLDEWEREEAWEGAAERVVTMVDGWEGRRKRGRDSISRWREEENVRVPERKRDRYELS